MSLKRFLQGAVLSYASLAVLQANATDDSELTTLKHKAETDSAAAYEYALHMRANWESDVEFDYLYGVLALSQKKYHEAQFALEFLKSEFLLVFPGFLAGSGNVRLTWRWSDRLRVTHSSAE